MSPARQANPDLDNLIDEIALLDIDINAAPPTSCLIAACRRWTGN
jgi:hypothetical protein